jgi:6-phosphofructo-2-kinase/fructose-2,6-biphosphatase
LKSQQLLLLLALQAIRDFKQRILKYNEVYEPIDDRRLHYIKLIDM